MRLGVTRALGIVKLKTKNFNVLLFFPIKNEQIKKIINLWESISFEKPNAMSQHNYFDVKFKK